MASLTKAVSIFFSGRRREIDRFRRHPAEVQEEQLKHLLKKGAGTVFGREHSLGSVGSVEQFQASVGMSDYEGFHEYIARAKAGEQNVIWPSRIKWFAKSSGTTDAKSKYIPVSDEGLKDSHMRGPRDVAALFAAMYPDSRVYNGKTLTLGGSKKIEKEGETAFSGDLSAILLENTPGFFNFRRVPKVETALIPDFAEKVKRICEESIGENVASFAGVPSWNLVMLNKVLEYTGKDNLLEVWPNLELFIHGGMNFAPYREQYHRIIPSPDMKYMETYNASEGFFAIADDPLREDMLLMLDYRVFYEFLPVQHIDDRSKAVPLEGVREGVNYAMIITTSNGLWRYMIGDTVVFTSTDPYRIRITGRTKHYINAFGEEVVIDNAEKAIREACDVTGAEIAEFTVAPVYMVGRRKGAHEWVVEFSTEPDSYDRFAEALDKGLQKVNSDYEAKRFKSTTLDAPKLTVVPKGTFMQWMESRGKAGGQNKVPRLYNDRTFVDELLAVAAKNRAEVKPEKDKMAV